jgi:serine/threonine protein kinase
LADRYRLGVRLGSGGTGEVHEAWDTLFNRPVAVKILHKGTGAATRRRFQHEVRTLAGLAHPGVVTVFDGGTDGSRSFVVMRLVEGGTLRDRMASGAMDTSTVRELGASLAEALDHIHSHRIVHRDVTPANILLGDHDRPHLADFGLARLLGSPHLTNSGQIMGTAAYLAPEQVRGQEVAPAADIYALGLILLECLTGRREFEGGPAEVALARLHRPPHIPVGLPEDLAHVLALMTSLLPHRRPTAAHCAQALRGRDLRTTVDVPAQHRRRTRRRRAAIAASTVGPLSIALAALLALPAPLGETAPPPPPTTTRATPPPVTPFEAEPPPAPTAPAATTPAQQEPPPRATTEPKDKDPHNPGPGRASDRKKSKP